MLKGPAKISFLTGIPRKKMKLSAWESTAMLLLFKPQWHEIFSFFSFLRYKKLFLLVDCPYGEIWRNIWGIFIAKKKQTFPLSQLLLIKKKKRYFWANLIILGLSQSFRALSWQWHRGGGCAVEWYGRWSPVSIFYPTSEKRLKNPLWRNILANVVFPDIPRSHVPWSHEIVQKSKKRAQNTQNRTSVV